MNFRIEKDFLGEKKIPADKYYGIHTMRALENFQISEIKVNPSLIKSLALVKKACAIANSELGFLSAEKSSAIIKACDEIASGGHFSEFPLDALQGGAGTSTNMNINEVIANIAIELAQGTKGNYDIIHPIEDVNLHQSTNDVYPTAVKISAIYGFRKLSATIERLQGAFQKKEGEFSGIVKIGRTELQEAVPMTLGAEFAAFADAISRDRWRTFKCEERLRLVNIGGTAIGTGICAPKSYIFLVIEKLRELTGLGLSRGENVIDQTANADVFVEVSGILKAHAANLHKISNDLRLLNLLGEIVLPKLQAGSSIMAGKVNPVVLEAVAQTAIKIKANDAIITECVSGGSLQINEFMPLIAHALLESLEILANINIILAVHIADIKSAPAVCQKYFDKSVMIATAFIPYIGYDKVSAIIKDFVDSESQNFREFLNEKLGRELVEKVLSPFNIISLGYNDDADNT